MNCQQFECRVNELLDERLALRDDDLLTLHSQNCPACQRKLCEFELLRSYFDANSAELGKCGKRLTEVAASSASTIRFSRRGEGRWLLAALAAALLAAITPLIFSKPGHSPNSIALVSYDAKTTPTSATGVSTAVEMPWPSVLATLEALPQQLDNLGPVYFCTAHLTGVSSLTSSLSLTVDLLRTQLNLLGLPKQGADHSQGRRLEMVFDEQLA